MNTQFLVDNFPNPLRSVDWLILLVWWLVSWLVVPVGGMAEWTPPVPSQQVDDGDRDMTAKAQGGSRDVEGSGGRAARRVDSESEKVLRNRLIAAAIIGSGVLSMLGIVFGYLRLDHATRGFYSGRLQSIAAAAAIVVLLIGYLLWVQLIV